MKECGDFEAFYAQYKPLVLGRVRSLLCRYPSEVEDVVQIVFVKAWQAYERVDANDDLKAWMYRIASNAAFDLLRSKGGHSANSLERMVEETERDVPDTNDLQQQIETRLVLARVLHRLSERSRVALQMQGEGYSLSEIAAHLGTTRKATKMLVYRARLEVQAAYRTLYREARL